jgi:hypothetical protein
METTLRKLIKTYGENDSIVTRLYIDTITCNGMDCLSVGYDNENENELLTFWQDHDDRYSDILGFRELTPQLQKSIYEEVIKDFPL